MCIMKNCPHMTCFALLTTTATALGGNGCHCSNPPSPAGSPGPGGCGGNCCANCDGNIGVRGTETLCLTQWTVL